MDLETETSARTKSESQFEDWKRFYSVYRTEVLTAGVTLVFLFGIIFAVVVADLPVYKGVKRIYNTMSGSDNLGTGNRTLDCRKKDNRRSPYCEQWRARQKSTWRGIQRHGGSETPPAFSLHGGE